MDSFGSDRKLSELGLDIPDFLDPVIDPAELFPSVHHTMAVSDPLVSVSDSHHLCSYQHPNTVVHAHVCLQAECSTSNVSLVTTTGSSRMTRTKNEETGCFRRRFNGHNYVTNSNGVVDEEYDDELKLIDVVDDDDEVILDSGWLDDILDNERQSSHDACAADDVIGQQHVSDEHSYSLANGTNELGFAIKMEADDIDMDSGIFEMINPDLTLMNTSDTVPSTGGNCSNDYGITSAETATDYQDHTDHTMGYQHIKNEPLDVSCADPFSPVQSGLFDVTDSVDLPLTPPSSSGSSSDSEAGGLSPHHSPPSSPYLVTPSPPPSSRMHQLNSSSGTGHHGHYQQTTVSSQHSVWTTSLSTSQQPFFSNPLPSSGILILSEEEKRTLVAEGYPIPSKLPLTKQEEKNLKKIRRKIKNKISAQESRRKKKEYLETLEKKVESVSIENINLKKRVDLLESNNRSLISQLQKLQSMHKVSASVQSSACITVN